MLPDQNQILSLPLRTGLGDLDLQAINLRYFRGVYLLDLTPSGPVHTVTVE